MIELNDVSEMKDGIGEALVTITPEMCRQAMAQRATPFDALYPVGRPTFRESV